MIIDGLLSFAAACAWATVLWFYARTEYREARFRFLLLLTAACTALFWLQWWGWMLAAVIHYLALQRFFDHPARIDAGDGVARHKPPGEHEIDAGLGAELV